MYIMEYISPNVSLVGDASSRIETTDYLAVGRIVHGNDSRLSHNLKTLLESVPLVESVRERVITLMYIISVSVLSVSVNCTFVRLVVKHEMFHTPHMVAVVADTLYNLVMALAWFLPATYVLITDSVPFRGSKYCSYYFLAIVVPFFAQNHSVAFVALERLVFFWKPVVYGRTFTVRRVVGIELIFLGVATVFSVLVSTTSSTYYSSMSLMCLPENLQHIVYIAFAIFYVPAVISVSLTITFLSRIVSKHRQQIRRQNRALDMADYDDGNQYDNLILNIRSGIRLVLCISATDWLSYLPLTVSALVFLSQFTLTELELDPVAARERLVLKYFHFATGLGYVANSAVHFYVNKALRIKFMEMFKRH